MTDIKPNPETRAKKVVKNVGSSIAEGVKEGAKLAAASEFNDLLVGIISKTLIEKAGVEKETLESPFVHALLSLAAPVLIITLTEMFGDKIPQADKLKGAAEIALTAVSYEEIGKLIAPFMGQLVGIMKAASDVIDPSLGLSPPSESVIDSEIKTKEKTKSS